MKGLRLLMSALFVLMMAPALYGSELPQREVRAADDDFPRIAKNQSRPGQVQTAETCSAEFANCDLNDDGGTGGSGGTGGGVPCVKNSLCKCGTIECHGECAASTYGCRYMSAYTCISCAQ